MVATLLDSSRSIFFTASALRRFIESHRDQPSADDLESLDDPDLVYLHDQPDDFLFHRDDKTIRGATIISQQPWKTIEEDAPEGLSRLLERVDRAARAYQSRKVSIPRQWHKYSHNNLLSFFAVPARFNLSSYRWVAEILQEEIACFWLLTSNKDETRLSDYESNPARIRQVLEKAQELLPQAIRLFPPKHDAAHSLQPGVDLKAVGSGPVTQSRGFDDWIPALTAEQLIVLNNHDEFALKVRGQAGSGKTLTLELKILADLYRSIDEGEMPIRQLFVTHSWAMAQQVEQSLNEIDRRQLWQQHIDVMPLTFVKEMLQGEVPEGVEMLGEDSLDGKRRQLLLIQEAIGTVVADAWQTFEANVSDHIRTGALAKHDTIESIDLAYAFMREFTEVIDAQRLKPGIDSLRKYLEFPRESWMIAFDKTGDLEFAFAVYRQYVTSLVEEGQVTTDQIVDDFRLYLEGYVWNIRRVTEGFDAIFVDEFHLFNDTERYLFHLLTRDVEGFPRLVIASDPAQSPFALLTGLRPGALSRTAIGRLGPTQSQSVELQTLHRFTPALFDFVQFLYGTLPNLVDLGSDWTYELAPQSVSFGIHGEMPRIAFMPEGTLGQNALAAARTLNDGLTGTDRVAVIGLSTLDLEGLIFAVSRSSHQSDVTTIEGRDEIERLSYSRKTIVVTSAEYAAGLQFTHVIVVAGVSAVAGVSRSASAKRATISQMYLAVTRASRMVTLFATDNDSESSGVLRAALESGTAVSG